MTMQNKSILYNLKVLYVEDEGFIREELSSFIKRRVGKLYVGIDGEDGLIKFNEHKPDMIITDLKMPKIDGIEMARKIRSIDSVCPIIVITAISDIQSIVNIVDVGIDSYIIKPIDTKELIKVMEKAALKIYKIRSEETIIKSLILEKEEKKEIEMKIQTEMAKFIKNCTGKGPKNVQAFIQGNILSIQFFETRTVIEKTLLENSQNIRLVDYNRELLFKDKKKEIEFIIQESVGVPVKLEEILIDSKLDIDQIKLKIQSH